MRNISVCVNHHNEKYLFVTSENSDHNSHAVVLDQAN